MRESMIQLILCFFLSSAALPQQIKVIESKGPGAWRNVRLVEELRIGQLEGDDKYLFGDIHYIVPTTSGSVFVADGQA